MTSRLFDIQDLLLAFQHHKVLTRGQLLQKVGCSAMTIWRLLDQHGYLTSYNDNARHYTLADVPTFNEHGLWNFRNARFSQWGSLTDTIVGLVQQSPAGLDAEQLEERLGVQYVKSHLSRLFQRGALWREKCEGRFVYFAPVATECEKQQDKRHADVQTALTARHLPPLEHIIAALVEIIRRPRGTPQQWVRRLKQQGVPIATKDIEAILAQYEIDPKKGLSKS